MIRFSILAMMAVGGPAAADVLSIKGCTLDPRIDEWMTCQFTNETQTPIASFSSEVTIRETGRTVPWVKPNPGNFRMKNAISGGLEPGETASLPLRSGYIDARANRDKLLIDVQITGVFDVNDNEILDGKSAPDNLPIDDQERQIFEKLKPCWNVGALSSEALRTPITLVFSISGGGIDSQSIASKVPLTNPNEEQAYEAARRAAIRCGSDGRIDALTLNNGEPIEVTFDPNG